MLIRKLRSSFKNVLTLGLEVLSMDFVLKKCLCVCLCLCDFKWNCILKPLLEISKSMNNTKTHLLVQMTEETLVFQAYAWPKSTNTIVHIFFGRVGCTHNNQFTTIDEFRATHKPITTLTIVRLLSKKVKREKKWQYKNDTLCRSIDTWTIYILDANVMKSIDENTLLFIYPTLFEYSSLVCLCVRFHIS